MYRLMKRFFGPYKIKVIMGVLCKGIEVIFDLITPFVIAALIDYVQKGTSLSTLFFYIAYLVVFAIVGYFSTLVCQKMAAVVSQHVGCDIRETLYAHSLNLSTQNVERFSSSSLITRATSDINQVQVAFALGIRMLIRWPILAVGSLICAFSIDAQMGILFLVASLAVALVFWFIMRFCVPLFSQIQVRLDAMTGVISQSLEGVRVIRAFTKEKSQEAVVNDAISAYTKTAQKTAAVSGLLNPVTIFIMNSGIFLLLWLSSGRIDTGELTQGQIVAFISYMTQTMLAIMYVSNLVVTFTRAQASAARILEVLDTPLPTTFASPNKTAKLAPQLDAHRAALTFNHVTFSYGSSSVPALKDITFSLPSGKSLGVIGGTGSGKSTIAQLICAVYPVQEGSITYFGHSATAFSAQAFAHLVSLVPQKNTLFSGTVRSNLLWRNPQASDQELTCALASAQALDFVSKHTQGLDTPVEAEGKNFSGGQRQRLTIARALVNVGKILVLDDASSALDFETEAHLRSALTTYTDTARVVISQRVATVAACDKILVLDHGRQVGLGSHKELLQSCPLYQEIAASQHLDTTNALGGENHA